MSREIKFRAWDKKRKEMYYFSMFEPPRLVLPGEVINLSDLIIMQYTGLHDGTKWESLTEEERAEWTRAGNMPSEWKGKEVYEGDICKYTAEYEIGEIGEVYFTKGIYLLCGGILGAGDMGAFPVGADNCPNIEVIGNVWENPELMEAKQ